MNSQLVVVPEDVISGPQPTSVCLTWAARFGLCRITPASSHPPVEARPTDSDWGPTEWCSALEQRFFGEQFAQLPVMFFVDDSVLAEIHPGHDRDHAVASLCHAVRVGLTRSASRGYFDRLEHAGRRWKLDGAAGAPPFLHLLAVCVLAASRMGTGNVSSTNYSHHLCRLLDVPDRDMPRGFRDSLYYLWDTLTWWLDDANAGRLGLSTVVEDSAFTHIGRPISQTLFRGADCVKLDDFFRWSGMDPAEQEEEATLVALFRAWPGRVGLSSGAARMLKDRQFDQVIGRILVGYARTWDGTGSRASSTRRASLRVVVQVFPRVKVMLGALQPDGFPNRLQGPLAGRVLTADATDGVFSVAGEVNSRLLARGLKLGSADCQLTLGGSDVFVLALDADLGGWASVDSIDPGARHWILVSASQRTETLAEVDRWAQERGVTTELSGALGGWCLIRDVIFDGAADLKGALGDHKPSPRRRFSLRGGLPLKLASTYLAGGAPDVWLPARPQGDASLVPRLDGKPLPARSEQVRLAKFVQVQSGDHEIQWAGATRRFSTLESTRIAIDTTQTPEHHLAAKEDRVVEHHAAHLDGGEGITVQGAIVNGPSVPSRPAPALVNRAAQRAWLLGARVGEVHEVRAPARPEWIKRVGLLDRKYEARADFEIAWLVEERRLEPLLQIRAVVAAEPEPPGVDPASDEQAWTKLISTATLMDRSASACERLERFRALAVGGGTVSA